MHVGNRLLSKLKRLPPPLPPQTTCHARSALIIGGEDVPKAVGQSCDLVVLPFFSYTYYAPLMRPGASPEAVRALNAAAVRMMYDGSHAAIQDKYYGTRDVPPCSRTSYKTSVAVTWDEVSRAGRSPPARLPVCTAPPTDCVQAALN